MRLSKGQKRGQKQEDVVTGLYTIAPYPRTPQEVVGALLQKSDRLEPLLAGQIDTVITALEARGQDPTIHGTPTAGGAADGRLPSLEPTL